VRAATAIATALALLVTGCAEERARLPPICSEGPEPVLRALRAAPDPVRLADGTALSECVARAGDDAELQMIGFAFTPVADRLNERATPDAAVQLGYLVGAVRRGASRSNGIHVELVRRMESRVQFDDPALLEAAERAADAGEATG
jgi:hypothetical protein